jgi:hypothetical protein
MAETERCEHVLKAPTLLHFPIRCQLVADHDDKHCAHAADRRVDWVELTILIEPWPKTNPDRPWFASLPRDET